MTIDGEEFISKVRNDDKDIFIINNKNQNIKFVHIKFVFIRTLYLPLICKPLTVIYIAIISQLIHPSDLTLGTFLFISL